MALLQTVIDNPFTTLTSIFAGVVVTLIFQVCKFYYNLKNYPPGPLPLPIVGNVLEFRNRGEKMSHHIIFAHEKKFGGVFTFWAGNLPHVVVTDPDLAQEALTKVEFAGRKQMSQLINDVFFGKGGTDVVFGDFGREWEVLRKVAHTAARKFAVNSRLPSMVHETVAMVLKEIEKDNGENAFDPTEYLSLLVMSLLATSAYGKRFTMDDPDFQILNESIKRQLEGGNKLLLISFVPPLRYVYRKAFQDFVDSLTYQRNYTMNQLDDHKKAFNPEDIKDFTDAMIAAMKEAEEENSDDVQYLKKQNVANTIRDLFAAGSDTSQVALQWSLLLLAAYPDVQKEIRKEVQEAFDSSSSEFADFEIRDQCPLLQAFIMESFRFRSILPFTVPHKAIVDTELGGVKIKKDTAILISLEAGAFDSRVWDEPHVFKPQRFLDEQNKFNSRPNRSFTPFGGGKRTCLGSKLALANLALILAGFMNQTKGKLFSLPDGPTSAELKPDPNAKTHGNRPKPYKLILTKVQ